jgi:molybdate transport system ATP-binding protein
VDLSEGGEPAQTLVRLEAGGEPLLARITRRSAAELAITPGTQLFAQVKGVALMDSAAAQ